MTDHSFNFTKLPTPMTRAWRWGVIKALIKAEWRSSRKVLDYVKSLNYYLYSVVTNYQHQGWRGPVLSVLRKIGFNYRGSRKTVLLLGLEGPVSSRYGQKFDKLRLVKRCLNIGHDRETC